MTEREKREKVIRGLECCLGKDNRITYCEQCPYKTEDTVGEYKWPGVCDIDKLHQDALALLKAQEPRVMTLEELQRGYYGPVWVEWRDKRYAHDNGWKIEEFTEEFGKDEETYIGKDYRYWTSRPTDEQREKEKWE